MRPWEPGFYLTCVGLVSSDGDQHVVWFDHSEHEPTPNGTALIQTLVDGAQEIVGHNLKHDLNILRKLGVNFEGKLLHCTMVSEYILSGQDVYNRHFDLNSVAEYYDLEPKDDKVKSYWDNNVDTYDIPAGLLEPYVLQDCLLPLKILFKQKVRAMASKTKSVMDLQNEFILSLSDIEMNGFKFDKDRAQGIVQEYGDLAKEMEKAFQVLVGERHINMGSPIQLSAILYGGILKLKWKEWTILELKTRPESKYWEKEMKEEKVVMGMGFLPLPKTKRDDGYFKTSKEVIVKLKARTQRQREIKALLLKYSAVAQVVSQLGGKEGTKGLMSKIQPDGFIHCQLNQALTKTGRLSSSDPNSQNLPREGTSPIKECIIPRYDGILQCDLKQVEWRGAAELSGDGIMIHEVNKGVDQHTETCIKLMELGLTKQNRNDAKVFNFRMIYGGSAYGFWLDVRMPKFTLSKWKQIVTAFFDKYLGLREWHEENIKMVFKNGMLQIKTGRWFKFSKTYFKDGIESYSENQIKNYPVQGLAGGDCLPLAAVVIRRGLKMYGLKSKMILTVHDSIVFDYINEELPRLIALCSKVSNNLHWYVQHYFKCDWQTKLAGEIEIGPNYGHLEEVHLKVEDE
jgi:DNA polymerase-1